MSDLLRGCVLTVGNFDGVHVGHQRILSVAADLAASAGVTLCVLTFDPAPAAVLAPKQVPDCLLPAEAKHRLLAEHGGKVIVVVRTTPEFLAGSAREFVQDVLVGRFQPRHIVEGPNFFFGHDRSGTVRTLQEMAAGAGFEVTVVEPLQVTLPGRGRVRVSSSLVRGLIRAGDVEAAARCLGRPFTLYGRVIAGHGRGRVLEFPTANVDPNGLVTPADGVYAARAEIGEITYPAAVSIGARPTFNSSPPAPQAIEVHLLDADDDFYDRPIAVTFLARLRDQETFPDADALKARIKKDIQRVRELCR